MMSSILEYKGYRTRIEYDVESKSLRGKIEGISDYVDFECGITEDIEREFQCAVDDYLSFCEEVGKAPEKEYKGLFNIRIAPELHKRIAQKAFEDNCSVNSEVEKAIAAFVMG